LLINRSVVDAVGETRRGAHFTSCAPDYDRDEAFQAHYAAAAADPASWAEFSARFLDVDEPGYQDAVQQFSRERLAATP
jgi:glutaconate CoA-transferase, subunit A